MSKKLVYGVGINNATYVTQPKVDGKQITCKVYKTWKDMLRRCYDPKYLEKKPTYIGCSVDKEWHSFMNFRGWMVAQNHEGKHLDKDLLVPNNKVYSKDTCVFISSALNVFMPKPTQKRLLPVGATISGSKYMGLCSNPFTKSLEYLGTFDTPEEAHQAWKKYKHELALEYAKLETDPRIIKALETRYAN